MLKYKENMTMRKKNERKKIELEEVK